STTPSERLAIIGHGPERPSWPCTAGNRYTIAHDELMRLRPPWRPTFVLTSGLLGVFAWLMLVVGCGGPTPGGDGTPPKVVSTVPADGAAGVALNRSVVITFSEPMDRAKTQAAIVWTPDLDCGF